jgi:Flp pilus assembly protein TadD
MNQLLFWKNWDKEDRGWYLFALGTLMLSLLCYLYSFWWGDRALIQWSTQSELEDIPVVLDSFRQGIFNLQVDAFNYVLTERFIATDMAVNITAGSLFMGFLALGVVIVLTVLTFLSRFWYVAGMAAFIVLLVSFRIELLALSGLTDRSPFITLITLYGGLSYYFHAFRTHTSLSVRLLSLVLLTGLVALVMAGTATVSYPALHLSNYGIWVPLLIGIAFTFLIAAEIPYAFLYLVTRSNTPGSRNSFLHFSVACAIYLFNLLIIYLKNAGIADLDLLFLSPYVIYVFSAVLGIWGHRTRSQLYEGIIPHQPYGALLYTALGTISTATFAYLFATGNDPLLEVFEDVIVFSHLAMGLMFFLYVVFNFGDLLQQNLKVYKVVFKPARMPYFMVRAASALIMVAFFMYANMVPYQQALGGYYNGLGDLSTATKEYFLAEQYYKMGLEYSLNNHKSSYALGSLARLQNDPIATEYYFRQATLKNPRPYDYANLGSLQIGGDHFFEALFTLKEGVRKFPESGELYNNLALLYNRTSLADSAFLYFDLSREFAARTEVPASNLQAFWAKNSGAVNVDSLQSRAPALEYLPFLTNRTVLQNLTGNQARKELEPRLHRDSTLNRNTFAYLFNQAVGQAQQPDTTLPQTYLRLEQRPDNGLYAEDLAFARACYEYRYGNRGAAIATMKNLAQQATDRADLFNRVLGAWLLQQQAYLLSTEYSSRSKDPQAKFYLAVALSEAGREEEAQTHWKQIVQLADSVRNNKAVLSPEYLEMNPLASKMLSIYAPNVRPEDLDEEGKLMYLLYRKEAQTEENRAKFASLLPRVSELAGHNDDPDWQLSEKAQSLEKQGQDQQAEALYVQALKREPLNENLILSAARFYREKRNNNEKAYELLVNSVQLNPYSVAVYKEYIRQSLTMGLVSYATQGLNALKSIASPADYQTFLPEYQSKMALIEKEAEGFQ